MSWFNRAKKLTNEAAVEEPDLQFVSVYLQGVANPDAVFESEVMACLKERLESGLASANTGELDCIEAGPEGIILELDGPDAGKLFATVRPILDAEPMCRGARVVLRFGEEGAPERELWLQAV